MKIFTFLFLTFFTLPAMAQELTPNDAHRKAAAGEIILIDIRRRDEWQLTGVGIGAEPIDMRDDDFIQQLQALTQEKNIDNLALICARGGRSAQLAKKLRARGFENIFDVPEGMLGYSKDTGWVNRGLPIREYEE